MPNRPFCFYLFSLYNRFNSGENSFCAIVFLHWMHSETAFLPIGKRGIKNEVVYFPKTEILCVLSWLLEDPKEAMALYYGKRKVLVEKALGLISDGSSGGGGNKSDQTKATSCCCCCCCCDYSSQ